MQIRKTLSISILIFSFILLLQPIFSSNNSEYMENNLFINNIFNNNIIENSLLKNIFEKNDFNPIILKAKVQPKKTQPKKEKLLFPVRNDSFGHISYNFTQYRPTSVKGYSGRCHS